MADASRRTTTANAYVAGLGPTRRVVLYDTILDGRFPRGELLAVAAHELAHVGRRHLWKGLGWLALLAVPGVFLLAHVTERNGGLRDPAVVPFGLLVALLFYLGTLPLQNLVRAATRQRRAGSRSRRPGIRKARWASSGVRHDARWHPTSPRWVTLGSERIRLRRADREARAFSARTREGP